MLGAKLGTVNELIRAGKALWSAPGNAWAVASLDLVLGLTLGKALGEELGLDLSDVLGRALGL